MEEANAETIVPTDVELMEDLVRGDTHAMEAIYERYESTLRAVILSVLHEETKRTTCCMTFFSNCGTMPTGLLRKKDCMDFWLLWPGDERSIVYGAE